MTFADEAAHDLLRRLLAGDRSEDASLHLAMLLEKSSPLASGDDVYRQILPPELSDLRLSPETREEIISIVCQELSRNPTDFLISAISFTGADLPTRTAVNLLTNPPRPLSLGEIWGALSLVTKFLPYSLSRNPDFVPKADVEAVVGAAEGLQNIEETGTGSDRSARIGIKMHAAQLLRSLKLHGIIET